MTKRKPGLSFGVRLPWGHGAEIEVWASERGIKPARLASMLLCLAVEEWRETGKLRGIDLELGGAELDAWLLQRENADPHDNRLEIDDGIPF